MIVGIFCVVLLYLVFIDDLENYQFHDDAWLDNEGLCRIYS